MGIVHKFGVGFLIFFGVFLLYFNLCLVWNIQPFPALFGSAFTDYWNDDYYFGFESVFEMIDRFPTDLYISEFNENLEGFIFSLNGLGETLHAFSDFIDNPDIFKLLEAIWGLITAPIQCIAYFIITTVNILITIVQIISWLAYLFNGNYNIPMSAWNFGLDETTGLIGLTTDTSGHLITTSLQPIA